MSTISNSLISMLPQFNIGKGGGGGDITKLLPSFQGTTGLDPLASQGGGMFGDFLSKTGGPAGLTSPGGVDKLAANNPGLGSFLAQIGKQGGISGGQATSIGPLFSVLLQMMQGTK